MVTSIERIAHGVNSRTSGNLQAGGIPTDTNALGELALKATKRAEALTARVQRCQQDLADKTAEVEREVAEARTTASGEVRPKEDRRAVEKHLREQLSEHHRAVLANSAEEREAALRELNELREAVSAARELFTSPVAMLTAAGIGSERRSRIYAEAQHLGNAALANLAKRAVAEGDAEMAGALVSVNDSRPSDKRAFSSQELARAVVGRKYDEAQAYIDRVESEFDRAMHADRELRTGRRDPMATLKRGLANKGTAPGEEGGSDDG